MSSAASEQVFSIPFRYLWSTHFAGDLEKLSERPSGIARFVGDQNNEILNIFTDGKTDAFNHLIQQEIWPLVLFGSHGTGKTSLALTIIEKITENSSSQTLEKPIVLPAVDFDRRFRAALETDTLADFRKRFFDCGGIVIDDVHQLIGKPAAQIELSILLDLLANRQRPIIFTVNQHPQQVDGISASLASQLSGGLSLPVENPGIEARQIIICDLCQIHNLNLTSDAVELLLHQLNVSVPKIVHFFYRLLANLRSQTGQIATSTIDAASLIRMFDRSDDEIEKHSLVIIQAVANEFNIKPRDLSSHSRKQSIVLARGIAIYLIRKLLGISFGKIGNLFGNRDHSTIMHAFRKTETIIEKSADCQTSSLQQQIEKLDRELTNQFAGEICLPGKPVN